MKLAATSFWCASLKVHTKGDQKNTPEAFNLVTVHLLSNPTTAESVPLTIFKKIKCYQTLQHSSQNQVSITSLQGAASVVVVVSVADDNDIWLAIDV